MFMIKEKQGKILVNFARKTIKKFLTGKKITVPSNYYEVFEEKRGVFVTLEEYPSGDLRGCIGLPYPEKTLIKSVEDAAISASRDPRFPPLDIKELDKITVEVSVLTEPEKIEFEIPEQLLKKIKVGEDGLILKKDFRSGLFLPQVWEKLPDKKEFLENLSYKAGLKNPDAWKSADIFKFQVQAFKEKEPGKI